MNWLSHTIENAGYENKRETPSTIFLRIIDIQWLDFLLLDVIVKFVNVLGHFWLRHRSFKRLVCQPYYAPCGSFEGHFSLREKWRREGDSNPRSRSHGIIAFEATAFDHSAISPYYVLRFLLRALRHFEGKDRLNFAGQALLQLSLKLRNWSDHTMHRSKSTARPRSLSLICVHHSCYAASVEAP